MHALVDTSDLNRPHQEGQFLAGWLRNHLGLETPGTEAKPDELLRKWNVSVTNIAVSQEIEAISVWGKNHGPAILLNSQGLHNRSYSQHEGLSGGSRATLAHEICHLLIDRRRTLPVAEVLGGSTPLYVEQRANAFAAEFLVPRAWAKREHAAAADAEQALDRISARYRVTNMLAARQLLNEANEFGTALSNADRSVFEDAVTRWS